jgi:hypothetical protein
VQSFPEGRYNERIPKDLAIRPPFIDASANTIARPTDWKKRVLMGAWFSLSEHSLRVPIMYLIKVFGLSQSPLRSAFIWLDSKNSISGNT